MHDYVSTCKCVNMQTHVFMNTTHVCLLYVYIQCLLYVYIYTHLYYIIIYTHSYVCMFIYMYKGPILCPSVLTAAGMALVPPHSCSEICTDRYCLRAYCLRYIWDLQALISDNFIQTCLEVPLCFPKDSHGYTLRHWASGMLGHLRAFSRAAQDWGPCTFWGLSKAPHDLYG